MVAGVEVSTRRRHDLAPGHRHDVLDATLLRRTGPARRSIKVRAIDDSGNISRPRPRRSVHLDRRRTRCSAQRCPKTAGRRRHRRGRARRASSCPQTDGFITGVRFYKGTRQHRHAHRHAVDRDRQRLAHRHVHQRDGDRLADPDVRHAGRRSPRARPTSRPTTPRTATTPTDDVQFSTATDHRPAGGAARRPAAATGCLPRRRRLPDRRPSTTPTTGWT